MILLRVFLCTNKSWTLFKKLFKDILLSWLPQSSYWFLFQHSETAVWQKRRGFPHSLSSHSNSTESVLEMESLDATQMCLWHQINLHKYVHTATCKFSDHSKGVLMWCQLTYRSWGFGSAFVRLLLLLLGFCSPPPLWGHMMEIENMVPCRQRNTCN